MSFAFYLPNLLVIQAYLHGRGRLASPGARRVAAGVLVGATAFLVLGTFFFTTQLWGPAILGRLD